jgi:hypothetical protein
MPSYSVLDDGKLLRGDVQRVMLLTQGVTNGGGVLSPHDLTHHGCHCTVAAYCILHRSTYGGRQFKQPVCDLAEHGSEGVVQLGDPRVKRSQAGTNLCQSLCMCADGTNKRRVRARTQLFQLRSEGLHLLQQGIVLMKWHGIRLLVMCLLLQSSQATKHVNGQGGGLNWAQLNSSHTLI